MHTTRYISSTQSNAFFIFAIALITPILPTYIKSMGFKDTELGYIFAILPVAIILLAPFIGVISDKIGRNKLLNLAFLLEISALCTYILATNGFIVIIARIIDSVAIATFVVIALAKIEDKAKNKTRGKQSGKSFSILSIGKIVGPVIGGVIADALFIKAPFILALVVIIFNFQIRKESKKISKKHIAFKHEFKKFFSHPELITIAILGMAFHATIAVIAVFLPLRIVDQLQLSFTLVGVAFFMFHVPHAIQFVWGKAIDKKGAGLFVILGALSTGIAIMGLYTASNYYSLIAILFIAGIGDSIWNIAAWTYMSNIGEKRKIEGEIIGTFTSLAKIGGVIGLIISGVIILRYDIKHLFLFFGLILAITSLVSHALLKKRL